ncbi:hypothetical protein [Roseomonas acroporae]|nr:hypothetical protein [Roseomonas acroporae]
MTERPMTERPMTERIDGAVVAGVEPVGLVTDLILARAHGA